MDIWPALVQTIQCVPLLTISIILDIHFFPWILRASECWGFSEKFRREISSVSLEANNLALSVTWKTKSDLHYFKREIKRDKYEQIKGNKAINCTLCATWYSRGCWNTGNFCQAQLNLWASHTSGGVFIISLHNNPRELIAQHHFGCF